MLPERTDRRLRKARRTEAMEEAIRRTVSLIPRGKVSTYAGVAASAGYPMYHRQVVQVLRKCGETLPWYRVLGAGGQIRLPGEAGLEQRLRLEAEGVVFTGRRVDMERHEHSIRVWEFP